MSRNRGATALRAGRADPSSGRPPSATSLEYQGSIFYCRSSGRKRILLGVVPLSASRTTGIEVDGRWGNAESGSMEKLPRESALAGRNSYAVFGPEDELYREARRLYEEDGIPLVQTGKRVGVSGATVGKWARRDNWKRGLTAIDLPSRSAVDTLLAQGRVLTVEQRADEAEDNLATFAWMASKVLLQVSGPQLLADASKVKALVDLVLNLTRGRAPDIAVRQSKVGPAQIALIQHFSGKPAGPVTLSRATEVMDLPQAADTQELTLPPTERSGADC
jgi:hypothetical protein